MVAIAAREQADVTLLAGPDGGELLRAVLAAEGVDLVDWSTHKIEHRPGVGVTVGWTVTWSGTEGLRGEDYLLATTCPVRPGPGMTTVRVGDADGVGRALHVWRHPFDPALPGLAAAATPGLVDALLGDYLWDSVPRGAGSPEGGPTDVAVLPADPGRLTVEVVTYRPLRRSVLRVKGIRTVYLKVVRPHTARGLVDRHGVLRAAGLPAARATELAGGVVALDALPGRPLSEAVVVDDATLVAPEALIALLDRLPDEVLEFPRRIPVAERTSDHARAGAAAVPDRAAEVLALGREIAGLIGSADAGPVVPSHGDLHSANVLVDGDDVVELLDVDQVGPGHRVDDLACLIAHLSVLPVLNPTSALPVRRVLVRWTRAFDHAVNPVALRARAAAVVLSLVAGARRDGQPGGRQTDAMLEVAREWLVSGSRVAREWLSAAGSLRDLSSPRPERLTCGEHAEERHRD